jgi:hypothetical protein
VSDAEHTAAAAPGDSEHTTPHLPPNSLIPIVMALSLAVLFVGFLSQVRDTVGPFMWVLGLLGVIGCSVGWVRAARSEYLELPEEEGGH